MSVQTMQALAVTVIGERAEVIERPRPVADDNTVIVRALYSGVSIGTELWMATGKIPGYSAPPMVPGYQCVGEIVEVGAKVTDWKAGDVVAAFGGGSHAQFVKARESMLHRLPSDSIRKVASLFVQPSVGANAINQAGINAGDSVLVIGQGLIGQCTAQIARLRGAYVIATDISPERLAISARYCADWVVDSSKVSVPDEIKKRFPSGVDVVIESTGFQALVDDAMKCVRSHGRFVYEGHYPGTITHTFRFPHEKQVRAFYPCFIGDPPVRHAVLRLMASSRLEIEPLISHVVPWREAATVYNKLFTAERDHFNGIVFDWTV